MLKGTYFPAHEENRMEGEGDVERAREMFLRTRPPNLEFLLAQRYGWMNSWIRPEDRVVELGSGAGFAREFLKAPNLTLTDVVKRPWIDQVVDAMEPPFPDGSVDVLVCSHMIHHLAHPALFFDRIRPKLAPGGRVLIQEINTALLMRVLLRLMRHEGWSYQVDVFDPSAVANDPADPWSANCAIPQLLFSHPALFEQRLPGWEVAQNRLGECFLFPLSGGVIAKSRTVQLPRPALRAVAALDRALVALVPSVFALGRSVVLRRKG